MRYHTIKKMVFLYIFTVPLWGAEFLGTAQAVQGTLRIPPEGKSNNVYAAAATVILEEGAKVKGNLYAAGHAVLLNGRVQGSSHLAGVEVCVKGGVGGDLLVIGKSLNVLPTAAVSGELMAAGLQIDVEGPIRGGVRIVGGQVLLNGLVGGATTIRYDRSLSLGPSCRLKGKIVCYGPQPPTVEKGAVATDIDYRFKDGLERGVSRLSRWTGVFGWAALIRLAVWLFTSWLLTKFFWKSLKEPVAILEGSPWRCFGIGLGAFLAFSIGIPVLFLTVIGAYVSLMAAASALVALLLARLVGVIYLGFLIERFVEKEKELHFRFRWTAGAVLILHLLGCIPLLGWGLTAGLTLSAFGALARLVVRKISG